MNSERILIVEDDPVSALDIKSKLAELGYQVIAVCVTGEDAVEKALTLHPDLILMDVCLKGKMDGVQAAQEIHARESIAVIYLTVSPADDTLQRAKITEPYAYIQKPVSTRELHIIVDVAIYKHRIQREVSAQLQRLTAMCMVDEAILNSHDPHYTMRVALHQIIFQLDLDAAAVLLFDPSNSALEFFEGYGFRTVDFQAICVDLGREFVGKPSQSYQIEQVRDVVKSQNGTNLDRMREESFVGYIVLPLFCKDQLIGILEVFRRSPLEKDPEWLDFLMALANQVAVAIDNASMVEELRATNLNMVESYDATILGWSAALEMREPGTLGHSQKMTEMTLQVAQAMGIEEKELDDIRRGALLHDVGKMGVPDHILLKPGELTPEEWEIMRRHTSYAKDLLSFVPFLKPALDISIYHHERWDGTGYPEGLKGESIPLSARIFAVVDVWDALLSDRPYRKAWPKDEVVEYLRQKAGSHFDPQVVDTFLKLIV